MSHIEEEFEKIESERGWNTLFRVSYSLKFIFCVFFLPSLETCK